MNLHPTSEFKSKMGLKTNMERGKPNGTDFLPVKIEIQVDSEPWQSLKM